MIRLDGRTTWYLMNWSAEDNEGTHVPTGFQNVGYAFGLPNNIPHPDDEEGREEAAKVVEFLDLVKQDLVEKYGLVDDEGL